MPKLDPSISSIDSFITTIIAGRRLPRPGIINIEPVSNLCQLKCPLCPTGMQLLDYPPKIMSLDIFKAILGKVPFISVLELYRSGEPFLNPDLFAMIRYARGLNVNVVVSSHFSFSKPNVFFENIVTSGLGKLFISLDGTSQKSYSHYRVGGDYAQVMANIITLIETKKNLRCTKPEIIWQFLVNKYNEHEIATARNIAKNLGIALDIRPLDLDDELPDVAIGGTIDERMANWLPANEKYIAERYRSEPHSPLFPGLCKDLFTRMIVTVDGKVMPCCMLWNHNNAFGDLLADSFDDIWYSRKYLDARSRFLIENCRPQVQSICYQCNNYGTTPQLRDKLRLLLAVYRKSFSLRVKKSFMKFVAK